jgi:hypothetical protein
MKRIIVSSLVCLLISCHQDSIKPDSSRKPFSQSNPKIEKAFVSFRISVPQWISKKRSTELFNLFDKYKGVTDEITFFTSSTHPPIPLDIFTKRAELLRERMAEARKRGYKSGINVLSTLGHRSENLDNSLKGDYTNMTNINGEVRLGTFCPNDQNMQEYIRSIYVLTAKAKPDYIWIDDDIRLERSLIGEACFCDNCLKIFKDETGIQYTRESLKDAQINGTPETKQKIFGEWLQHNKNTISRLLSLIEKTVHEVDSTIPLGLMSTEKFYEGYDFDNWVNVLSGSYHIPVMWRPGGGFLNDTNIIGLIQKSHSVGRQVSILPQDVLCIQSEIENFTYQRLKKAANIVVLEACSYIAAGCTGTAFNVLSFYDEPLDEYEPLLERIKEVRPFLDLMVKTMGRSPITGIHTFWNKNSIMVVKLSSGSQSGGNPITNHEIYNIGLPACYSVKNAQVTILGKNNILALSKDEIKKLLCGGIYLDAETLQQLNDMGFSEYTGFKVVKSEKSDRIEKFTVNTLNGGFAGRERDNRQSFWNVPAYTLLKTNEKAQVLACLVDYTGKEVSSCTMGIFENKLGGRICVEGYYPWTFMEDLSKSSQMKSVFRWLSRDKLTGYVGSFQRINLWIREPEDGKIALSFINSSFDPAKDLTLMLQTENKAIRLYDMECRATIITSSGVDGPYKKFVIPYVDPWQMRLVVTEN